MLPLSLSSGSQNCPVTTIEVENLNHGVSNLKKLMPRRKGKRPIDGSSTSGCIGGYKLKVKYDGYFKTINNGTKNKYCLGRKRTLYLDPISYKFCELTEEVDRIYHWEESVMPSLCFLNRDSNTQSFIKLKDDSSYQMMLEMYKEEKEVVIYVTANDTNVGGDSQKGDFGTQDDGEDSYHSLYSTDNREENLPGTDADRDVGNGYEGEFYSYNKENHVIEIGAKYPHTIAFRRALNHYAIMHDFEFAKEKSDPTRVTARCAKKDCSWRVHASVVDDGVTLVVKTLQPKHMCSGVNKSGNKHATKGRIADRIIDDLRSEGDTPAKVLKRKLERKFGIQLPYLRVWNGKELAMEEIYGKWNDSFAQVGAFE